MPALHFMLFIPITQAYLVTCPSSLLMNIVVLSSLVHSHMISCDWQYLGGAGFGWLYMMQSPCHSGAKMACPHNSD